LLANILKTKSGTFGEVIRRLALDIEIAARVRLANILASPNAAFIPQRFQLMTEKDRLKRDDFSLNRFWIPKSVDF
jgi:hypothetical protein